MERRRSGRDRRYVLTAIRPLDGPSAERQVQVCLTDIGPGGVSLVSACHLEPGWEFLLTHRDSGVAMLCTVAHAARRPDGSHAVGASFTRVVTPHGPRPGDDALRGRMIREMIA